MAKSIDHKNNCSFCFLITIHIATQNFYIFKNIQNDVMYVQYIIRTCNTFKHVWNYVSWSEWFWIKEKTSKKVLNYKNSEHVLRSLVTVTVIYNSDHYNMYNNKNNEGDYKDNV